MKIRDPQGLWQAIERHNLNKHIGDYTKQEIERLADLFSIFCESEKAPSLGADGGLIIPFAAPYLCRWWQRDMEPREQYELITRLGADPARYMYPRAIARARGECDNMGRKTA